MVRMPRSSTRMGSADTQTGRNQWDLLQAYVDVTLPGVPVRIRAGKWIELAGFEHFSANIYGAFGDPARALYSYSYQFLYAEPGTQTGVLVTYVLNPQWTFDAGFTRGWNQSTPRRQRCPGLFGPRDLYAQRQDLHHFRDDGRPGVPDGLRKQSA